MIRENLLRVISILVIIAIGLYTSIAQGNPTRLVIVLPLVAILIAFLLFLHAVAEAEKRINQSLDRRLPPTEHLENRDDVERETVKLVENANEFIIATGGRSRNKLYLKTIENKVNSGDLPYWRSFTRNNYPTICANTFARYWASRMCSYGKSKIGNMETC